MRPGEVSSLGVALFMALAVLGWALYEGQEERGKYELRTAVVQVCADRPDPLACADLMAEALEKVK